MTPSPSKRSTSLSRRLREYRRNPISVLRVAVMVSTLLTVALFVIWWAIFLCVACPTKPSLLSRSTPAKTYPHSRSGQHAHHDAAVLAAGGPVGVFASVYLVEYATRGSRCVTVVRRAAETLSGIPSILYGLFGTLFLSTSSAGATRCWPAPLRWPS